MALRTLNQCDQFPCCRSGNRYCTNTRESSRTSHFKSVSPKEALEPKLPQRPSQSASAAVDAALRENGQPLSAISRGLMERRFGYDFSRVRVHTDAGANESAHAVNAHAFTVGEHIVFARG